MSNPIWWLRATSRRERGQRRATRLIGRSIGVLAAASLSTLSAQAQTPAGTEIRAAAEATYETPNGLRFRAVSDTLVMIVGQVAGFDIETPTFEVGSPGSTILFRHTLTNVGNGVDSVLVSATSRRGWPTQLTLDANGSPTQHSTSSPTLGPLTLVAGASTDILLAVTIPDWTTLDSPADTISVSATSQFDPSVVDVLEDVITIRDAGIVVSLEKHVDRATATAGDLLTYTIEYRATGPNRATDFAITDVIPDGTTYVPGTLLVNGASVTDAPGDDLGTFEVEYDRVVFRIDAIQGGDTGAVSFQVRVEG